MGHTTLKSFRSAEVDRSANMLPEGRHEVIVSTIYKINDRTSFKGKVKTQDELDAKNIDWSDSAEQLGVTFSKPGGGVASARFNLVGYKRFDELTDTEGFFQSGYEEPYAIDAKTNERVIDPERSAKAQNILNELFDGCHIKNEEGDFEQLPLGSDVDDLVGCHLSIVVVPKQYGGKDVNPDIKGFKAPGHSKADNIIDRLSEPEEVGETKAEKKARKKAEKKARKLVEAGDETQPEAPTKRKDF